MTSRLHILGKDDEAALAAVFGTLPAKAESGTVLADPEVDATIGPPPHRIARKKTRSTLWYRVAQAHSRTLQARHRDHVESYVVAVERLDEVERQLGRMPEHERYTDLSRSHRMWVRSALDQRDTALKALRSLTPFGRKDQGS